MSDDYVFSHFTFDPDKREPWRNAYSGPIRMEGIFMMLCLEGCLEFDINLNPCLLHAGSFMCANPGSILEMKDVHGNTPIEGYGLFVSSEFLADINFDLNVMSSLPVSTPERGNRVFSLNTGEAATLTKYFDLLHYNSLNEQANSLSRPIARNLIAALSYEMIQIMLRHAEQTVEPRQQTSRRAGYVHSFLRLVHKHHRTERSVAFYAGKLFISPKYLSLVVKEHTGRSAAQIIDSFVILEAKSLLRFSGKNIQQVAYELNFPNQSSFGKYFKHLAGMSPSEYQKSN